MTIQDPRDGGGNRHLTGSRSGLEQLQEPMDLYTAGTELNAIWDAPSLIHGLSTSQLDEELDETDASNNSNPSGELLEQHVSISPFTAVESNHPRQQRSFSQGLITLLVEGDEFVFDRVLFSGVSSPLSQAFDAAGKGMVDMKGVSQADVELLYDILSTDAKTLSYEQSSAILRIHNEWAMDELRTRAMQSLDAWIGPSSVQRVQLGRKHCIYDWVDQGLGELAVRQQDLTEHERYHLEIGDSECLNRIKPFAVVSEGDDKTFHETFPRVPSWDRFLTYYMCALQGRVLLQGWMYITKAHLCFTSTVGGETMIVIPFSDVVGLEKCYTALYIPNGISVATSNEQQLVFRSFVQRDVTFTLLEYLRNASSGRL